MCEPQRVGGKSPLTTGKRVELLLVTQSTVSLDFQGEGNPAIHKCLPESQLHSLHVSLRACRSATRLKFA